MAQIPKGHKCSQQSNHLKGNGYKVLPTNGIPVQSNLPIAFQVATLLSAIAHLDYLLFIGSRGFVLLLS
ncbi:MAG: hypothetical protein ACPGEF_06040, partial [Endozoicomonas sp.]